MKNQQKVWQQENPDRVRMHCQKHQQKKHDITKKEWESCLKYFNYECAYCGMPLEIHKEIFKEQLHKEHIDPNGANDLSNCVPGCKICNSEKHTDTLDEWYNFYNLRFHPDRYFKILNWINDDYKKIIKIKKAID